MSVEDRAQDRIEDYLTAPDGSDHLDGVARQTLDRENWDYEKYATVRDAFLAAEFRDIEADPDEGQPWVRAVWEVVVSLEEVR